MQLEATTGKFLTSEDKSHPFSTLLCHIASKRDLRLHCLTFYYNLNPVKLVEVCWNKMSRTHNQAEHPEKNSGVFLI